MESKQWIYLILSSKIKFPNFTILIEVFINWDFLSTRHLSKLHALMVNYNNSPNKCSAASYTAWHIVST